MFFFLDWNVNKLYNGGVVFIFISPARILTTLDQAIITLNIIGGLWLEITGKVCRDGFG